MKVRISEVAISVEPEGRCGRIRVNDLHQHTGLSFPEGTVFELDDKRVYEDNSAYEIDVIKTIDSLEVEFSRYENEVSVPLTLVIYIHYP